jgi:hypothetical protein
MRSEVRLRLRPAVRLSAGVVLMFVFGCVCTLRPSDALCTQRMPLYTQVTALCTQQSAHGASYLPCILISESHAVFLSRITDSYYTSLSLILILRPYALSLIPDPYPTPLFLSTILILHPYPASLSYILILYPLSLILIQHRSPSPFG